MEWAQAGALGTARSPVVRGQHGAAGGCDSTGPWARRPGIPSREHAASQTGSALMPLDLPPLCSDSERGRCHGSLKMRGTRLGDLLAAEGRSGG